MRVDDEGFAGFVELAAVVAAPLRFETYFVEDAPTAAGRSFGGDIHDSMVDMSEGHRQLAERAGVPERQRPPHCVEEKRKLRSFPTRPKSSISPALNAPGLMMTEVCGSAPRRNDGERES